MLQNSYYSKFIMIVISFLITPPKFSQLQSNPFSQVHWISFPQLTTCVTKLRIVIEMKNTTEKEIINSPINSLSVLIKFFFVSFNTKDVYKVFRSSYHFFLNLSFETFNELSKFYRKQFYSHHILCYLDTFWRSSNAKSSTYISLKRNLLDYFLLF